MNEKSVSRRLVSYAMPFRKRILWALLLLVLGASAELSGPFLAKVIIDNHILSIQKNWYQFEQQPIDSEAQPVGVRIEDRYYVREDWLSRLESPSKEAGKQVQVIGRGKQYFLLDSQLGADKKPVFTPGTPDQNGRMHYKVISQDRESPSRENVDAILLSSDEVKALYSKDIAPIILLVATYAVLILVAAGLNYVQLISLQTTAQRIIQQLRMVLFVHLQKLSVSFFDKTPVGQLVSRVSNDTEAIRELYVSVLATFVQNGIYFIGILTALFFLQPKLALFCCLLLPILFALVVIYRKYSTRYYAIIRSRLSDMNATINEMIQNMAVVQAFRREEGVQNEFAAVNKEYFKVRLKENNIESLMLRPAVDLIWKISLTVILWYFGSTSFTDVISFGALFAFVDYMGRFFEPINMIMNRLSQMQQALISAKRVFDILDTQGEAARAATAMPRPNGEVVFENVWFAYNDKDYVLKNVSFTAKPGETVALVGHTGSGKSSLMNLLLGFYPVTQGRILVDGIEMSTINPTSLREHLGLVLQDPFLFTGNIAFNIRLYNQAITDEAVVDAAKAVKADSFISQLPKKYEEPVVERGATLSAGQRQLISFARALVTDPAILILDEATASIDSETESAIQEALHVLSSGRTTFIIAHRLSTIQHADQILVLSRGEVVERGTHEELMNQQGMYQKMYQLQQGQISAKADVAQ